MSSPLLSLKGRLALITGAAGGIGHSAAQLLAEHGACLALADVSENVLKVAKDIQYKMDTTSSQIVKAKGFVCDVSKSDQVKKLFTEVKTHFPEFPAPTIIINSAGIASFLPLLETTEEKFDQMMAINVKGTFLVIQEATKILLSAFSEFKFDNPLQTYASIVNISSYAGNYGVKNMSLYSATKSSLMGFTKSVAKELGIYKIRTNVILPYYTDTNILPLSDKDKKSLAEANPMKRIAKAEEVANTILFLVSDASSFVNGAFIEITGGMNA